MQTSAGRDLATKKASDSLKFFRSLLAELRDARIAELKIRQFRIPCPSSSDRFLKVQCVVSPSCPECGGIWNMAWTTEKGIKCKKLNLEWACSYCRERLETSFCLPEIA